MRREKYMKSKLKYLIVFCILVFIISAIVFVSRNHNSANGRTGLDSYNISALANGFKEINLKKEMLTVYFEGNKLNLNLPIYVDNNRYYLPLTEIIKRINGKIAFKDEIAHVEVNNKKINIYTKQNYFNLNGQKLNLKKKAIVSGKIIYMSLFDIKKLLDLKIDWNEDQNTIGLFWNRDRLIVDKQPQNGKTALIRFEDVTAAQRYSTQESLEKLRTIFDYCYSKNIPMHLGWVPRYIDPKNKIDNDPAKTYSIHNANFIYTLDYFVDKNGIVGLHGYTHQHGNDVSIIGTEFNGRYNTSEKSVRERLKCAIDDANKLEIPIGFFESPHYAATPGQKSVIEKYFNNIYEYRISFREKQVTKINVGGRTVKYIPTPLGYLNGKPDINRMLNSIKFLNKDTLASFFFHPSIEFEFIKIQKSSDGYPAFEYSDKSPLKRIVNTFIDKGYTFRDLGAI
jgi:hypothetical protein